MRGKCCVIPNIEGGGVASVGYALNISQLGVSYIIRIIYTLLEPTTEEGKKARFTDNFGVRARPTGLGCNPTISSLYPISFCFFRFSSFSNHYYYLIQTNITPQINHKQNTFLSVLLLYHSPANHKEHKYTSISLTGCLPSSLHPWIDKTYRLSPSDRKHLSMSSVLYFLNPYTKSMLYNIRKNT